MVTVRVPLKENAYDIVIGSGAVNGLKAAIRGRTFFVVTDSNVERLYLAKLRAQLGEFPYAVFPAGETSKNLATVENVLSKMLEAGLNRKSVVVAFGGGVTGDLAGFAASIYMRGIPFIQVPTTLLAQVDSSVGGKTGVDFHDVKNIVGLFNQPETVLIDTDFLKTLDEKQILSGMGECVKTAFLNETVFHMLVEQERFDREELIAACVRFKADVVSQDEKESGLRKILNFGHTVGHALETLGMGGALFHGEYVLHGLYYEFALAKYLKTAPQAYCDAAMQMILTYIPKPLPMPDTDALLSVMSLDKKNSEGGISLLLPMGECRVAERILTRTELAELLNGRVYEN